MGRFLEYVVLLSNLSLILGAQQYKDTSPSNDYEKKPQENFTLTIKHIFPKDENDFFNKKVRDKIFPLGFEDRLSQPSQSSKRSHMTKTLGLQAYAVKEPPPKNRRRIPFSKQWRNGPSEPRKNTRSFSQNLPPASNAWDNSFPPNFLRKGNHQRQKNPRLPNQSHSVIYKTNNIDDSDKNNFHRKHQKDGRFARYNNPSHSPKVCDPCNSVPWIPLLKAPDSYRQQRTHVTEIHKAPSQDFSFDYKAYASDTHNILLPPVLPPIPLVPPLEPIYDGTISSSFGLPIGNIPTGHGLLAPINHLAAKINRYGANSIDYSNSLKFFPTQSLLESNPIPALSPVPIVPIHDSNQFYQVETTITNIIPQPTKALDVSNVVLTISENNPVRPHTNFAKDLSSQSSSTVNSQSVQTLTQQHPHIQNQNQNQNQDFDKLEIVKSIPIAEFTSSIDYKLPVVQSPSINPPNQPQYLANIFEHPSEQEFQVKKEIKDQSHNYTNFNFLVPPPLKRTENDINFNSSKNGVLPFLKPPTSADSQFQESVKASTVPRPLTSASLSWLFSDHSDSPTTSKSTELASQQFASTTHEIASIVNNELRPVSSQSFPISSPSSQNSDILKSKKIQIIIPYTTKNKNEYDNNALESVQHEVFQTMQPPVSTSIHENNSSRDFATSEFTPLLSEIHHYQSEKNRDRKVIDTTQDHLFFTTENDRKTHSESDLRTKHKYLSEMQHIISTNIRELLREEIEKSKTDQNYPLQNNIDNWTALEYSNHKIVETKEPKEILSQALAVTSIPGTSISHLLLPSKKIPNEYLVTTPLPIYDEPRSPVYNAINSSVDSKPFTAKPYATTNLYFPSKSFREGIRQANHKKENNFSISFNPNNHEKNYTEIGRGRVNNWGRLNENLVLPEAKSQTRKAEETTITSWTTDFFGSSIQDEKVQIVTPVNSSANKRNYTTYTYRRTTRQIHTTEKAATTLSENSGNKINQTSVSLNKNNSTKLERTSIFNRRLVFKFPNATTQRPNQSQVIEGVSKTNFNKTEVVKEILSDVKTNFTLPFGNSKNVSSEEFIKLFKTNKSEQFSINDVFPFRNKELPWELNLNISQQNFKNGRQRKSLIKQTNLLKSKATVSDSS